MNLEFHNGAQNPFEVGPKYMPMQFNEIFSKTFILCPYLRNRLGGEKSRGEGSLIEQDTIENVSEPNFFFNFLRKKIYIF